MLVCNRCGALRARRIENGRQLLAADCGSHRRRSRRKHAAIEAIIQMRAVPTLGRLKADRNRLRSGGAAGGHKGVGRGTGNRSQRKESGRGSQGAEERAFKLSSGGSTTISSGGISTTLPSRQTTSGTPSCLCFRRASRAARSTAASIAVPSRHIRVYINVWMKAANHMAPSNLSKRRLLDTHTILPRPEAMRLRRVGCELS